VTATMAEADTQRCGRRTSPVL